MSSRRHFDNPKYVNEGRDLDTDLNHYKSEYDRQYKPRNSYKVGVSMTYIDGSYFRTNALTCNDLTEALEDGKRWIELPNGGHINLGYVIHYEPYKFYDQPMHRKGAF